MVCKSIREGVDCPFMTSSGCSYNGGICHEIVEECNGCNRSAEFTSGWFCNACPDPSLKWKNGNCNLASHVTKTDNAAKAKLNPLKASKRGKR
jgi:hypothetical protein